CVYWDAVNRIWSCDGSIKVEETDNWVVCHFYHLTNFATLMVYSCGNVKNNVLATVSLVGESVSSFCLVLTILSFLCVPNLRNGSRLRGAVLLVNLSMALLLLNVLLMLSEQKFVKTSRDSCLVVGVLLHFALLASFSWMMVEAVNLCLIIVTPIYNRVHVNDKIVFILSHGWGWLVPSLFVAIICGVDLTVYRRCDDNECWMKPNMIVYFVIIPMSVVFIFNITAYIAVVVALNSCKNKYFILQSSSNTCSAKRNAAMSVTTFVLLGLTWVFGFGISGRCDDLVRYVFVVFNSLQGFFIFCLFIVRNKSVR
uniref:G-protein coupled receptors family 2 profile 2 domain-containing protein n=1 Tax=Ciona savignyi TaxID=51511 RepID=H2ZHE2_CIOSA